MTELKNDRYLRALLRQPVDVTPVWMMRRGPLSTGVQSHSRSGGRFYVAVQKCRTGLRSHFTAAAPLSA